LANFVYITLDTTAPSNPVITISGGAVFTTAQLVNLAVSVGDGDTTGYQMLIWGDVDATYDTNIKATEATSSWMTYNATPQIKLSTGDGNKTINLRVRDDVNNASSVAVDSISMDTSIPTVTVSSPDVSKISKVTGKNTFSFTFSSNENFVEYKVKLVGATGATENTGITIPTAGGSTNTSGVAGNYTSGQVITTTIKGADLESAGATTDGQKIIKVFVKDTSNLWSV
jgi:hypothetical protein